MFGMRLRSSLRVLTAIVLMAIAVGACSKPLSHPVGWKPVDYRGVRIYVPAPWSVVSRTGLGVGCIEMSPPSRPLVVLDQTPIPRNLNISCALASSGSTLKVVVILRRFTPVSGLSASISHEAVLYHIVGHPVTVHGLAGYYSASRAASDISVRGYIFYKSGVALLVASTDQGLIQRLLATVTSSPARS